ncbi:DUF982 domain-containing protein [Ochrobactrum sp. CM-21-5]|nr:DUF982 domain-containing protein [Ochrobactrum sp. CM-21-5]MBC2884546.1 DUF982 domain-containing protein [Ochrobactrum sp. CM-21-5]
MNWNKPVAIKVNDLLYSIRSTHNAEWFMLRHWTLFDDSDLEHTIMACLLSWPDNTETEHVARTRFVHACAKAGILITANPDLYNEDATQQHMAKQREQAADPMSDVPLPIAL